MLSCHEGELWTMARMSLDEVAENRESMEIDAVDLPPITEELSAAERAEFERNLHPVQPTPSHRLVVFLSQISIANRVEKCNAEINVRRMMVSII